MRFPFLAAVALLTELDRVHITAHLFCDHRSQNAPRDEEAPRAGTVVEKLVPETAT